MTADDLIRAVADAIAAYPAQPDAQARAAIRAVHEAMREPSAEMVEAWRLSWATSNPVIEWRAMLSASPLAEAARDE